ncbi:hypothetical protein RHSIM_Rhsim05G0118200 [Rhododendron simsii]|uniref:NIF system FeS cluster assembly NifU C-terminal domain-containing protein n=1 Tax=Rhododendron simsii TaxID=118357 RepID=A0A834LR49_RHOSS|nr:hypothetical protein RHSIM_Rhsim05G0118200 [Rhododendron simsii]
MHCAATLSTTSYSYCRAQQTLGPSCSAFSTPLHPSSRVSPSRRSNLVQRSIPRSLRIPLPTRTRRQVVKVVAIPPLAVELPLTAENVESVLDEIRPYLISDGGNVALHEIDGNVVRLKLQGACGSCPSSVMTMVMGIEHRLMEEIPEIVAVEPIANKETGLESSAPHGITFGLFGHEPFHGCFNVFWYVVPFT